MHTRITPFDTYLTFKDRVQGNGVQKLDTPTKSGFTWINIKREAKWAKLAKSRAEARAAS